MRRRLLIPTLIAALAVGLGAPARRPRRWPGRQPAGHLQRRLRPARPAARQPAPVDGPRSTGRIATTDGSHPPPLRRIEVELNRNGRLDTKGLPVCTAPTLQSTSTETALARCRSALVGRGRFDAEVKLGREIAAAGGDPRLQQPPQRQAGAAAPPLRRRSGPLHAGRAADDRPPQRGAVRDRAAGEDPAPRRRPRLGHRNRPDDRSPLHASAASAAATSRRRCGAPPGLNEGASSPSPAAASASKATGSSTKPCCASAASPASD